MPRKYGLVAVSYQQGFILLPYPKRAHNARPEIHLSTTKITSQYMYLEDNHSVAIVECRIKNMVISQDLSLSIYDFLYTSGEFSNLKMTW